MRLLVIALAAAALVGCTNRRQHTWEDGRVVEFMTFGDAWAPSVTMVRDGDQVFIVHGTSGVSQVAGASATAFAGYRIGEGLKESGDTNNIRASSNQEQTSLTSSSALVINKD